MKQHKHSTLDFLSFALKHKTLRKTPIYMGLSVIVTALGFRYLVHRSKTQYESTAIFQESTKHLMNYEPIYKYVGRPITFGRIESGSFDETTCTMVVPFKGPKGKAKLIINGRRDDSDNIILDRLDVELKSPYDKSWTFYKPKSSELAQAASDGVKEKDVNACVK